MMTDHQRALEVAAKAIRHMFPGYAESDGEEYGPGQIARAAITAYLAAIGVVVDERNIQ